MANILVVDDTPASVAAIIIDLEKHGHSVTCVPNGREALASVLAGLPDVVLLDLLMPEMDGPSFLEVVRSYLRLQSLPVVVLTAAADSPMVQHALSLKVNAVLVKGKAGVDDVRREVEQAAVRVPG